MHTYIVFDLETTGKNSKLAEIIEISALKVVGGSVTEEYSALVKPPCSIDPYATAVNGITDDMVANCPTLSEVLPSFVEFVGDFPLLGYNILSFDIPILKRFLPEDLQSILKNDRIDVLTLARERLSFLPERSLPSVASHFGISTDGAHRALHDCYITKCCFDKLLDLPSSPKKPSENRSPRKQRSAYTEKTKALQTLHGFLLGVVADNILTESEVLSLKKWLDSNCQLSGEYPFDRVFSLISSALRDGILDQYELDEMLTLFKEFTSPIENTSASFDDFSIFEKSICLTGDFEHGERSEIQQMLTEFGAICVSSVTRKTDLVVVGSLGSEKWSCGSYGSKVKKAKELQEIGLPLQIIKEMDLFSILENSDLENNSSFDHTVAFPDRLQEVINQIIDAHNLPLNSIHLYSNVSTKGSNLGNEISKSICIFEPDYPPKKSREIPGKNFIVLNVKMKKEDAVELTIRNAQFDSIVLPDTASVKLLPSDKNFAYVTFNVQDNCLLDYIEQNILYSLANYESSSSFGCCSKFLECSDAKECLHENKIYSMGCKYRKNLDSGKIFYGINKNL